MGQSTFIKLVPASKQTTITLQEVTNLLMYYQTITQKTGEQLSYHYEQHAFPYEIIEQQKNDTNYLYLKGRDNSLYHYLVIGTGVETTDEDETHAFIQIVLPKGATYADKNKANEFAKFFAKKLNGELHLFNGRIMYFYKQK